MHDDEYRYIAEIYCGGTYCGNAFFDTFEECCMYLLEDGVCDYMKVKDLETGRTIKTNIIEGEKA